MQLVKKLLEKEKPYFSYFFLLLLMFNFSLYAKSGKKGGQSRIFTSLENKGKEGKVSKPGKSRNNGDRVKRLVNFKKSTQNDKQNLLEVENAKKDGKKGLPVGVESEKNKNVSGAGETASTAFNENAPKGQKPIDLTRKNNEGGGSSSKPDIGDGNGVGIAYPQWYPMCLFIDSHVTNDVNETIKEQIKMAAACDVNLVIFPMTVKSNYSSDPNEINKLTQAACNINERFGVKASSVSICVNHPDSPARMCNAYLKKDGRQTDEPDLGVAGCAQLQSAGGGSASPEITKWLEQGNSGVKKFENSGGLSAPSIEKPGSCNAGTVAHESQGHSQMGLPNGVSAGNNIGLDDPGTPPPSEPEGSGSGGWKTQGCQYMKANSFGNDGKWKYFPNKKNYFKIERNPNRQWDLQSKRKMFGPPISPAGPDPVPLLAKKQNGIFQEEKLRPKGIQLEPPSKVVASVDFFQPGSGHKKKAGKAGVIKPSRIKPNTLEATSLTSTPPLTQGQGQGQGRKSDLPEEKLSANLPTDTGKPQFDQQLSFNESVSGPSKGNSTPFSGTDLSSRGITSQSSSEGGVNSGFNEDAPRNATSAISAADVGFASSAGFSSVIRLPASLPELTKTGGTKNKLKQSIGIGTRKDSWSRTGGAALRKQKNPGDLYQSGGVDASFESEDYF